MNEGEVEIRKIKRKKVSFRMIKNFKKLLKNLRN